ncbi:MAG: FHA domain-containing protein, partial [Dehalococcoidales bacterium]|nr:FHA domain-containing protein [Dehalococcoidales bacterium]
WSGDLTDVDADSSLLMNSPKDITANWHTDYLYLYILIGGAAVLVGATITTTVLIRRRGSAVKVTPAAPIVNQPAAPVSTPPPSAPASPPAPAASTPTPPPAAPASTTPPVAPIPTPPPVSPAPTPPTVRVARGKLLLPDNSEIQLTEAAKDIGRDDFTSLASPDNLKYVSRQHCRITTESGRFFIEDLQSANGTKVNGVEIADKGRQELKEGDVIELASLVRITFRTGG